MIKIAVVGDIGAGKSYVAKQFGYPVFDADREVVKLYRENRKCYYKFKKKFPTYITSFPVQKSKLAKAVLHNRKNIKIINKIVHPEIQKKMNKFIKKNKNKRIVVLDIPLLIENNINKKNDVIIFVDAKKKEIEKRLKKITNFKLKIVKKLRKFQLPIELKKKKSNYIIKNNFRINLVKKNVKSLIKKILVNA